MSTATDTRETVQVIPRWQPPEGQGAIGIAVQLTNASTVRESYPFWKAIPMGVSECIETYVLFKKPSSACLSARRRRPWPGR